MQQTGTSVARCPSCGQGNYLYELNCKACGVALTAWQSLPPEELQRYTCWKCGGRYTVTYQNSGGSGTALIIIGLFLAPVLIGIVLIIIGISQSGHSQAYWQCRSCGLTLPV